jgi:hypothetical protein
MIGLEKCCETCQYSEDYGESVEYIVCEIGKRKKYVRKCKLCEKWKEYE